jgi:hypothetical protein
MSTNSDVTVSTAIAAALVTTAREVASNSASIRDIIFNAVHSIIGATGLIGNIFVIIVIASSSKMRKQVRPKGLSSNLQGVIISKIIKKTRTLKVH